MDTSTIAHRLRTFLLVLAGSMCAGTIIELLLAEHTEDPIQFIPFVLCGLGLAAVAAALLRPGRGTLLALRAVMGLLLVGSLLGVYEHFRATWRSSRRSGRRQHSAPSGWMCSKAPRRCWRPAFWR
jgi:hypothetical protein